MELEHTIHVLHISYHHIIISSYLCICDAWIGRLALHNDCTNGSADSAVSHICPRIDWQILLILYPALPDVGEKGLGDVGV